MNHLISWNVFHLNLCKDLWYYTNEMIVLPLYFHLQLHLVFLFSSIKSFYFLMAGAIKRKLSTENYIIIHILIYIIHGDCVWLQLHNFRYICNSLVVVYGVVWLLLVSRIINFPVNFQMMEFLHLFDICWFMTISLPYYCCIP